MLPGSETFTHARGLRRWNPEAFKIEAVRQVTEADHRIYDLANRLGTSNKNLYDWIDIYGPKSESMQAAKAELRWVTQERDILKEAARHFIQDSK